MPVPLIKVCGITNLEDAIYSSDHGADIIGVVLADESPRKGNSKLVSQLASRGMQVAGVYTNMDNIRSEASDESYIQLHFQHGPNEIKFVRESLGKKVISVVFPEKDRNYLNTASGYLEYGADMVLVDFGKGISFAEESGIPDFSGRKIGIAGKLYSDNIDMALKFKPYFIDLSSRLEKSPGSKDHARIRKFMEVFNSETAAL